MFKPYKPRCEAKISLLHGNVEYAVNKHITKLNPHLLKRGNKLFLLTTFNEYEVNSKNIIILGKDRQSKILSFIKNFNSIPRIIFVDVGVPYNSLNTEEIDEIGKKCKKQKILLKWLRELPYCICKKERSCKNCLSMFMVHNNSVIFCNGTKGKNINNYLTREEIFKDFKKILGRKVCKNFNNCIYALRNVCDGFLC